MTNTYKVIEPFLVTIPELNTYWPAFLNCGQLLLTTLSRYKRTVYVVSSIPCMQSPYACNPHMHILVYGCVCVYVCVCVHVRILGKGREDLATQNQNKKQNKKPNIYTHTYTHTWVFLTLSCEFYDSAQSTTQTGDEPQTGVDTSLQ